MNVKIKMTENCIGRNIPTPSYQTNGSAAFDLHACEEQSILIRPGQTATIHTGVAIELPSADYAALVFARSGLGTKLGIVPANCVGVIDSDYRGEVLCALRNNGDSHYIVKPGDRIAQMMIVPVVQARLEVVDELTATDRGGNGFGSTGL